MMGLQGSGLHDACNTTIFDGEKHQRHEEAKQNASGDIHRDRYGRRREDAPLVHGDAVPGFDQPLNDEVARQTDNSASEKKAWNSLDNRTGRSQKNHEQHDEMEPGPKISGLHFLHHHWDLERLHGGMTAQSAEQQVRHAQTLDLCLLVALPDAAPQRHQLLDRQGVDAPGNRHDGDEGDDELGKKNLARLEDLHALFVCGERCPPLHRPWIAEEPVWRRKRARAATLDRHRGAHTSNQQHRCTEGVQIPGHPCDSGVQATEQQLGPGSRELQAFAGDKRSDCERPDIRSGRQVQRLQQDEHTGSCQETGDDGVGKEPEHPGQTEATDEIESSAQQARGQWHQHVHVGKKFLWLISEQQLAAMSHLPEQDGHERIHVGSRDKLPQEQREHTPCKLRPHDLLQHNGKIGLHRWRLADQSSIACRKRDGDSRSQNHRQPIRLVVFPELLP
mmetsp:Transcript_65924/g.170435  ORF Transcript_65924/g.170435 Transcript_65924/m.170435 type:complete len:448 (+) Transcript_65924:1209-2552(+)